MPNRRHFLRTSILGAAGLSMTARSYARIIGANDRINVSLVGFSDRARYSLIPAFMQAAGDLKADITAVSDIWNRRRTEAQAFFQEKYQQKITAYRNNEELYDREKPDAVIISTADFQHALHCIEAVQAGCDVYVEKPLAETMEDNRLVRAAVNASDRIVQVGSQRRSGANYHAAYDFIQSGTFGKITMVEMSWNVNQPGRWRRPALVASLRAEDTDWNRFLLNRPLEPFDARKYLEYRLFWPYSSGIPGQWMSHQIDTVHWFSGFNYPRSVTANGGIYCWNDGRTNPDTMTAVFEYGPEDLQPGQGFQVVYSSRMHNAAGGTKEIYYSNGGSLNLDTNQITPDGGLTEEFASAMGMQPFLLKPASLDATRAETGANTGSDPMTSAHMRNWLSCLRSRHQPHAPISAGYYHSIANIMTRVALQTGRRVQFNKDAQEVEVS